ncbi:uncharacterized protein A4U43_C01F3760 [Asparagus officinalis]|uniref:BZIP domain-containing protein n=1 Tax=Asparagus officinalis TaxID=4686 RepID=A0A5P1FM28_ASPOF|nr:bZIP transcription factor 11-like [Asparagus officinalis]ONK79182.1 uncharacterized protein A4U43_C01F3760 [Asparagus officinalis]
MSSGTSSGSSLSPGLGSDGDLKALMDQRKRKRMQSNRESARRSRMRKQKHLDDLMTQLNRLRQEKEQILTALSITTQQYVGVEAENCVLRTQTMELSTRLQSLNEILYSMNANNTGNNWVNTGNNWLNDNFINPWNLAITNQPVLASIDMFQYC